MSRSVERSKASIFFMEVSSFLMAYLSTLYMTKQKENGSPSNEQELQALCKSQLIQRIPDHFSNGIVLILR